MKTIVYSLSVILLLLLMTACVDSEQTLSQTIPAQELSPAPQATTTSATGEGALTETSTAVAELHNRPWQWERSIFEHEVTVTAFPERYTILFKPDGLFEATIDCNQVGGVYTADDNGAINIELGPMTLAECGPDSRALDMINSLNAAQDYRFEEDGLVLVLIWPAAGPRDYFRDAGKRSSGEEGAGTAAGQISLNTQGFTNNGLSGAWLTGIV